MSYSATTGKLGLPQWVKGTKDHPDFLTDMNQAFEKIDGFAERTDNTVDGLPEQVDELAALVESMQEDVGEHTTELASLGVRVGIQENNVANLGVRVGNLGTRVEELEPRVETVETKMSAMDKIMHLVGTVTQVTRFTDFTSESRYELTFEAYRRGTIIHCNIPDGTELKSMWSTINVGNIVRFMCKDKTAFKDSMGLISGENFSTMTYGIVFATNYEVSAVYSLYHDRDDSIYIGLLKVSTAVPSNTIFGANAMVYREEISKVCESET